jgi:hypothetical protein
MHRRRAAGLSVRGPIFAAMHAVRAAVPPIAKDEDGEECPDRGIMHAAGARERVCN